MNSFVLDASAILAVAKKEAGADQVLKYRLGSIVSSVNHMEVVSKLLRASLPISEIQRFLSQSFPNVSTFDHQQAELAGTMHKETRRHGLSYADCACLALGRILNRPVLTGDRKWSELTLGVDVVLFR